ncbi:MAG: TIGR03617 family F420-dependent LLM class oxidoreductase [Natrialbaceae archaeon]|nr:TIGR03617 family F420-dependent LLM class oxidoreductase [Natrialbaceae archaeon]
MAPFRVEANVPNVTGDPGAAAARAEELGFDGVWTQEMANDAFLPHPLIADHTETIQQGTRIALAFTRSPMVLAYMAWDLAAKSNGRFVLGLGTQVKGHNERRFSVDWDAPGPRLREVVESIRHIFDVFQGNASLEFEGDHYQFSLMTEVFDPGPIDDPDIPIYIAGVNEYNVRMAGEICDGLAMHPFNTPEYASEVLVPLVEEGADTGGRSREDVALSASPLIVTGETEADRDRVREEVRMRIAFYGSTRTYHDVLEQHGWRSIGEELHDLSREQAWGEMGELVTDEMVATFALDAPPEELYDEAVSVYGDVADRIVLPLEHGEHYDL